MRFKWQGVEYIIETDSPGLNVIVERVIDGPGLGKASECATHRGKTSYHRNLTLVLKQIAKEGCRQVDGHSIDEILAKLEEIEVEFDFTINFALSGMPYNSTRQRYPVRAEVEKAVSPG